MRRLINLTLIILITAIFPFIILTISYNTQNLYSGGWQEFYQFLLLFFGIIGTFGLSTIVIICVDELSL